MWLTIGISLTGLSFAHATPAAGTLSQGGTYLTGTGSVAGEQVHGNVFALDGGGTSIRATGTTNRDGHAWLVADSGRVEQSGVLTGTNANGSGGRVDTDAARLAFGATAAVHAGELYLSMPAFTIDQSAARALGAILNSGTSVHVTTTGATGATGDIDVASKLNWSGPASLTLAAYRDVSIGSGATIANHGAGNLSLRADATGIDNGGSVTNNGTLDWSKSTGALSAFYDMNGTYVARIQLSNPAWRPPAFSGLVTQITAYRLVNSLADLTNVANNLTGNYALGKNINASATGNSHFAPIGNIDTPFTGQFDGQDNTITSLTLGGLLGYGGGQPLVGMFGVIGTQGVVRNLNISGTANSTNVSGLVGFPSFYMGLLAGLNNGTVMRVSTAGAVATLNPNSGLPVDSSSAGGLAGVNAGSILRSSSSASVNSGGVAVGDLAGVNSGLISRSFATGPVASSGYYAKGGGGLVGSSSGTISQSYATGSTMFSVCRPSSPQCGGAALVADNSGTITQSFATGPVDQPAYGPIGIARSNSGTIKNDVYWNTNTTGATIGAVYGTPVPTANGLSTAQMSRPASFVGYDFSPTGVWAMPAGATHPVLRWQLAQ